MLLGLVPFHKCLLSLRESGIMFDDKVIRIIVIQTCKEGRQKYVRLLHMRVTCIYSFPFKAYFHFLCGMLLKSWFSDDKDSKYNKIIQITYCILRIVRHG